MLNWLLESKDDHNDSGENTDKEQRRKVEDNTGDDDSYTTITASTSSDEEVEDGACRSNRLGPARVHKRPKLMHLSTCYI